MEATNSPVPNYFLNSLDTSVRQNLVGVARANPKVQVMETVDAVIRKDIAQHVAAKKVVVISGVGAGHEPMGAGYVGPYMLSAALSGSYFAAPPSGQIIKLVEQVADVDTPVLLVINNYTGDRLNFGLSLEYLKLEQFKDVRLFVFGDDFAPFYKKDTRGLDVSLQRRGLAGVLFINKIAGVLAELGTSLDEMERWLNRLKQLIFTFSVSTSACDIPGHGASFQLEANQMELGLGVHGESGVERRPLGTARHTLKMMLSEMVSYLERSKLLAEYNNRVAVIVNNLGSITQIEMNVLVGEVIDQLTTEHGLSVERLYSGLFMTSFNMKGFSVSLMLVDDQIVSLLDQGPQPMTCFTNASVNHDYIFRHRADKEKTSKLLVDDEHLLGLQPALYKLILKNICTTLVGKEQYLNQLDGTVGDSDCGSTIKSIAKLIEAEIEESNASFGRLARVVGEHIGGSSGALYSLLFTAASNYVHSNGVPAAGELREGVAFWHNLMGHVIDTIAKYSGARPGDRSMIDGLHGILLGLGQCLAQADCTSVARVAQLVSESTWTQSNKTATMRAKVGRASYVNEALLTEPDAGAIAVAFWVQSLADTLRAAHN